MLHVAKYVNTAESAEREREPEEKLALPKQSSSQMKGLFCQLSEAKKKAVLAYRGTETHGVSDEPR